MGNLGGTASGKLTHTDATAKHRKSLISCSSSRRGGEANPTVHTPRSQPILQPFSSVTHLDTPSVELIRSASAPNRQAGLVVFAYGTVWFQNHRVQYPFHAMSRQDNSTRQN